MTKNQNQSTAENLHAARVLEALESARRSKAPADGIRKAAGIAADIPSYGGVVEDLRFVAKRLEADPWDAIGAKALEVRMEWLSNAAKPSSVSDPSSDPLTVQPNLIFPLAPGHAPNEPMQRDMTPLTGRDPFYSSR
ncbi:hypothetical protein [Burkholderia ubonensis]|uniref:hypothetical protein n=1 Tax=Burkholderia ubonensis TaxID=101571 RepID=UPI000756B96E|nr:hypothetical protein [Burkholderia ubonensis]KVD79283.1 hypothetical protein WI89_29165 [Burkholderia ubonensis]KWB61384.1 hypothetical protein WL38_25340 [Burkholderia ubonensis]KWB67831.1 hypothetical protein WL39_09360 [Burkholderia ubonensis]